MTPERPQADASRPPRVRIVAGVDRQRRSVGEHQLDRDDLRRQVAQPRAGAVRAGGGRARDRLHVDVAEVLEREPVAVELRVEAVQRDAGLDLDAAAGGVDLEHAVHPLERDQDAVGAREPGE